MRSRPSAFYRPARDYPPPVPGAGTEVVVAAPPARLPGPATGWASFLFPVVSSVGSLGVLLLFLPGRRGPLLLAVAAGALALSAAAGLAARRAARRGGARHRDRYLAHLDAVRARLDEVATAQRRAAELSHPDPPRLLALVGRRERLWERRPADDDFLTVRLGRGAVDLACPVRVEPAGPLADHDPELLAAAEELAAGAARLPGVPVAVALRGLGVVAVTGPPPRARALARAMVCQLAVFHAPEDLRILASVTAGAEAAWDWLKWLPHNRPEPRGAGPGPPACLLASGEDGLAALLEAEARPRLQRLARAEAPPGGDAGPGQAPPHLVVLLDGFSPLAPESRLPVVAELLERAAEAGVTMVCLAAGRADEPAELRARIRLSEAGRLELEQTGPRLRRVGGVIADAGGLALCEAVARRLAPVRLDRPGGGRAAPPAGARLLDLLDRTAPDLADPAAGWSARPRPELLTVPIGVRVGGDPLVLDLKEAADGGMGPHGLVVGATGSGKSELLRTMVAGLALGHPPDLLSFVFVDFKGGAAFADLAGLPHGAGMITNLATDLTMVDRMRAALQGEQERRQRLLRQAGNLEGIGRYQARRAADPTLPPMPYLLLVVDEFGELLASRPDFLDLFVTIGRVGRSLGIHLVLASQRLDEGRVRGLDGHLSYRICLRTFGPAESSAVLGTADAYHLPPTPGAGWLKVGATRYERFHTALVAAPHRAATPPATPPPVAAFAPLRAGRPGARGHAATGGPGCPDPAAGKAVGVAVVAPDPRLPTDLEVAVAALGRWGRWAGLAAHQVWLPPLPPAVTLGQVLHRAGPGRGRAAAGGADPPGHGASEAVGWLRVPVGLVDLPAEQAQEPLLLDFSAGAGHLALVGAPRSGKSTLLGSIAAALALAHPPDAVQLYCIDLGGGLLHHLARLPHVGAVCARGEADRMRRLARELHALVADRQLRFRRHGVESMAAFHRLVRRGELPGDRYGEVFLLVDNWALLRQEQADVEHEIGELAVTGLHYGIHLVVAANRWADLRPALRDNLGGRLELRLNDPMDSELGRAAAAALPALPGRGLAAGGAQFQAALPALGDPGQAGERGLADAIAGIAGRVPAGRAAPPLRLLPAVTTEADLPPPGPGQPPGVPFAVEEHRLDPVHLDLFAAAPHFLVLGDAGCGRTSLLRLLARGLAARYRPDEVRVLVVDYRRTLADIADGPHLAGYACTAATAGELAGRLRHLLAGRLPPAPSSRDELLAGRCWDGPRFVVIVDDYDLLPGPSGNPLAPLADLLAQGRDVGLHLVVARPVGGTARTAFEPVFQRLRELGGPGLLMRGDPEEGPLLGGRRAGPLPPGRGWLVRRDAPGCLVQVAYAPAPAAPRAPARAARPPPSAPCPAPVPRASSAALPATPEPGAS